MVIDKILDRKDGVPYSPEAFYRDIRPYGAIGDGISLAMDEGTEADVKRELVKYLDVKGYPPDIDEYVESVDWIA